MDNEQFLYLAWTWRDDIIGWLKAEYQMDETDAEDLWSRYNLWGLEKDWQLDEAHTFERAIYRVRDFVSTDRRTKSKANVTTIGEGGSDDHDNVDVMDMMTVLASSSSAVAVTNALDPQTERERRFVEDRMHLFTERQREVIRFYVVLGTEEAVAKALGITRQTVNEQLASIKAKLKAVGHDPDEEPTYKVQPCEYPPAPNTREDRRGYRQHTFWHDPNEEADTELCSFEGNQSAAEWCHNHIHFCEATNSD